MIISRIAPEPNRAPGALSSGRAVEDIPGQATGFAACFTHLRTGNPSSDLPALFAALLADGTNLGLLRMADATRGLSYHHLVNQAQWRRPYQARPGVRLAPSMATAIQRSP